MVKHKRILALVLAGVMSLNLIACSKKANTQGNDASSVEATTEQSTEQLTDVTTEAPTEAPTDAPGILMPDEADKSTINSIIPGRVSVDGTNFVVGDKVIFMNGTNVPWDKWNDFGGRFSNAFWKRHFAELHEAGVNSVRVWISCDGTVGLSIKDDGTFVAAMPKHWTDLDKMFAAAEENGIYIMATLMSFDHFKDSNSNSANWRKMLESDEAMDSYINNYVIPFCKRYDSYDSLWSIDLCNEPDWIHENQESGKIAWNKICKLFAKEAVAIHENSDVLVTIGFGMIKYNSTKYDGNFGSDEYLKKLVNNDKAYLDFYSTHFYEWEAPWYGFPFDKTATAFGLDGTKPAVIGEFPANGMVGDKSNSMAMTSADCYINLYNNGWNGAFAWTSNGVDNCGKLADFIDGVKEVARLEAAK